MDTNYLRTEHTHVQIDGGLHVFTYDYRWGVVDGEDLQRTINTNQERVAKGIELSSNDWWFYVIYADGSRNLFNYERVTTICPVCKWGYQRCWDSGCGQRNERKSS